MKDHSHLPTVLVALAALVLASPIAAAGGQPHLRAYGCSGGETWKGYNEIIAVPNAVRPLLRSCEVPISLQRADINEDGRLDYLVVAQLPDVAGFAKPDRRLLLIIQNANGTYRRARSNDNAAGCSECGGGGDGDSFQKIIASRGRFTVVNSGGDCDKWQDSFTFRYFPREREWYLVRSATFSYSCQVPEGGDAPSNEKVSRYPGKLPKIDFARFDGRA